MQNDSRDGAPHARAKAWSSVVITGVVLALAACDGDNRTLHLRTSGTDAGDAGESGGMNGTDAGRLRDASPTADATGGAMSTGGTTSDAGARSADAAAKSDARTSTGGARDADPFCALPYQEGDTPAGFQGMPVSPTTAMTCAACETEPLHCPRDASGCDQGACDAEPYCSDYATAAEQAACDSVRRCVRQTNCAAIKGISYCFCGDADLGGCRAGMDGPVGPCKKAIVAGFPAGTSSADMLSRLVDVSVPAGGAMALVQCDHDLCASQCIPYCN
jgi:hypothetical protein